MRRASSLEDRIKPGVRVLFVGINPGIRSAQTGHHFAGYSNRFWKLLVDSELVPETIDWRDDSRLPEWGFGITNLVSRETPGIDTLRRDECIAGVKVLRRKVRRFKPGIVAFVGVSLYRWIFGATGSVRLGPQRDTFEGAEVFVLPNPSGRNANFRYHEMLAAFRLLRRRLQRSADRHYGGNDARDLTAGYCAADGAKRRPGTDRGTYRLRQRRR
jgi:TDG/mug DNA glycosylase family protein